MSGLVELARFNWAYEAELARAFLASQGLHVVVFDSHSNVYSDGALVGVRLMVLDEDADDALALMKDYEP